MNSTSSNSVLIAVLRDLTLHRLESLNELDKISELVAFVLYIHKAEKDRLYICQIWCRTERECEECLKTIRAENCREVSEARLDQYIKQFCLGCC